MKYSNNQMEISPSECKYYSSYVLAFDGNIVPITMEKYEIDVITKGCAHLVVDGTSLRLHPGDVCIRKPGQVNKHLTDTAYECIHMKFDVTGSERDNFFTKLPTYLPAKNAKDINDTITKFYRYFYQDSEYAKMQCDALLIMLKAALYKQFHHENEEGVVHYHTSIRKAIDFIEKNKSNPIRVEEIAEYCGFSTKYFQKIFKEATGKTPHAFIFETKMGYAKKMLAQSDSTINFVAQNCGFIDSTYFTAAFRKHEGVTPRQFRNMNK